MPIKLIIPIEVLLRESLEYPDRAVHGLFDQMGNGVLGEVEQPVLKPMVRAAEPELQVALVHALSASDSQNK